MIERDFLLRQVHQLAQVLAAVIGRRGEGDHVEAEEALAEGLQSTLGVRLDRLRAMSRPEVTALVSEDGAVSAEKAVALADVLSEDAEAEGRVRARWLYEAALAVGGPVPFDVQARLDALPEG
ncbi:hypothetical protein B1759_12325 [Rubrivirga sp. SAORIC476]|uniref:hypothetical protein n=1 Tax=Rubrivirga sp. SAORIC476 TaxID=1961794 RepID=UPI000BA927EE|nr:hypothetical protein [Rubrivirga sp. SAORIC476]PAP79137.1 hypothetical protein B1759_12325 [Rubrivirga sp. SAORIC476]